MKALLFRILVFTHRYIGIAIGWLLLMWCLSGMVMMYVSFPALSPGDRDEALRPLVQAGCCSMPDDLYAPDTKIAQVSVEMLSGHLLAHIEPDLGPGTLLDLSSGKPIDAVTAQQAMQVADDFMSAHALSGKSAVLGLVERDQWTVYSRYNSDRPLYHLAANDRLGTELYVSSITGRVVLATGRNQRFWNWLGAVPHWLYFTALRQHTALWAQIVIWSSVLGSFLTVFGLYLGVWQLRRKSDKRLHSPYRGWKYWHHVPGLLFGALVMSWVVSGLLSMNPWGWLETQDTARDARQLRGELPDWQTVSASLHNLPAAKLPQNTVRIESSVVQGGLAFIINSHGGERTRLDAQWQLTPLSDPLTAQLAQSLSTSASWSLLSTEDAYYYSHGDDRVELPVLRVLSQDAEHTRYYLDAVSGELLNKVDRNARWYRWLHSGLHRMDFSGLWRMRPFWDMWMWLLLLGATIVCATGTWLGVRHLRGRS